MKTLNQVIDYLNYKKSSLESFYDSNELTDFGRGSLSAYMEIFDYIETPNVKTGRVLAKEYKESIIKSFHDQDDGETETSLNDKLSWLIDLVRTHAVDMACEALCSKIAENFNKDLSNANFNRFIKDGFIEIVQAELTPEKIFGE